MTTIAPPEDPTRYLTSPSGHGSGSAIWQVRASCGLAVGGLDAVIDGITGFSPLEEWVMKPFAGDWDAFDKGADAWRQVGKALDSVAANIAALPAMVSEEEWQGQARDAWAAAQTAISQQVQPLPEACSAMAEYCDALAELARGIIEFVLASLQWAVETVLRILAEQAVPIAGQIAGAGELTIFGIRMVGISQKVIKFVERFKRLVEMISVVVTQLNNVLELLEKTTSALAAGAGAARTTRQLL